MSVTSVTHLHASDGHDEVLAELVIEGRRRMRASTGCESFDILQAEDDPNAFVFVQRWVSRQAHDAAFAEQIMQSGHLSNVLAAIDQPIVQHFYQIVP